MDHKKFHSILREKIGLFPKARVLAGISGGPDSVAMLSLLCEGELELAVFPVYVDHGLRPKETPGEIKLVKELSRRFGLEHEVVSVDTRKHQRQNGSSLEESARLLRYKALQECCRKHSSDVIAVAHTADDQAEEILLRLIRGTGLKGLSGMKMVSGNIVRPLLHTSKQELLTYLKLAGLSYCTDSSNSDRSFLRNRVRLDLLPTIARDFNPSIRSTLLQTSEILQEDESFLETVVSTRMQACLDHRRTGPGKIVKIEVDLHAFLPEHRAIQRRIVEKICWQFSSRPGFRHIEETIKLAREGKTGSEIHLPAGLRLIKSTPDTLTFAQPQEKQNLRGSLTSPEILARKVTRDKSYVLKNLGRKITFRTLSALPRQREGEKTLFLDGSKLSWPLTLRPAKPGERFSPQGMSGRKTVAKFLSDMKIPRHKRYLYPVLISQDEVVAVVGLRSDGNFAADVNAKEIIEVGWSPLQD